MIAIRTIPLSKSTFNERFKLILAGTLLGFVFGDVALLMTLNRDLGLTSLLYCYALRNPGISYPASFSVLPQSVRHKIYKLLVNSTRRYVALYSRNVYENTPWKSKTPVPSLLHLSQDARAFALRYYKLSFGSNDLNGTVYFDFERDGVIFRIPKHYELLLNAIGDPFMDQVKYAILDLPKTAACPWIDVSCWFLKLEDLILIHSPRGLRRPLIMESELEGDDQIIFPWQKKTSSTWLDDYLAEMEEHCQRQFEDGYIGMYSDSSPPVIESLSSIRCMRIRR